MTMLVLQCYNTYMLSSAFIIRPLPFSSDYHPAARVVAWPGVPVGLRCFLLLAFAAAAAAAAAFAVDVAAAVVDLVRLSPASLLALLLCSSSMSHP